MARLLLFPITEAQGLAFWAGRAENYRREEAWYRRRGRPVEEARARRRAEGAEGMVARFAKVAEPRGVA